MERTIKNLKEKKVLVARHIIVGGAEPTDENIIKAWKNISDSDVEYVDDVIKGQIRKYVLSNDAESIDKKIYNVRRRLAKNLKYKGKYMNYGGKVIKQPKNQLATFIIMTKGNMYSGDYEKLNIKLMEMIAEQRKEDK